MYYRSGRVLGDIEFDILGKSRKSNLSNVRCKAASIVTKAISTAEPFSAWGPIGAKALRYRHLPERREHPQVALTKGV